MRHTYIVTQVGGGQHGAKRADPVRSASDGGETSVAVTTPIIPVLVEDDWKAGVLWKALFDGGVFTDCAMYPAVPRDRALLRTSPVLPADRRCGLRVEGGATPSLGGMFRTA
jgi:hypothetical protein